MLLFVPAQAVGLKGNDTGGIIPSELASQMDVRQLAFDHCARYGKQAKFLVVDPQYSDYISFACIWTPSVTNGNERKLRD